MRSKKKRLRREATLRPATKDEMVAALQHAYGGTGGFARLFEPPPVSLLYEISKSSGDQLTTLPLGLKP